MKNYKEYITENKKLKNSDIVEKIDKSLLTFIREFIPNNMEVSILPYRKNLTDYSNMHIKIQYIPKNNENNIKSSFLPENIIHKLLEKYPSFYIKGTQDNENNKYTLLEGDLKVLYSQIYKEIDKYNL
jgi:hydroxymethylpyrimidine/phosphomethylpyrimidine kinase